MRFLTLLPMLVALAACSPDKPADPGPVGPPVPPSRWSSIVTGAGVALAYAPASPSLQTPPIRMSCAPNEFQVAVDQIIPIPSEDRLSVGFDGAPFALAVTSKSLAGAQGVEAVGPITQDLLVVLQTARVIQGSYGATGFGPYDAPPPAMLTAFVQGCRASLPVGGQ